LLYFDNLSSEKSLVHFSTTINGGVSEGNYSTFNLGLYSGDKPEYVSENRKRLADKLQLSVNDVYTPLQTHEDKICIIDKEFLSKTEEEKLSSLNGIDAVITNEKNIAIGVSTADCVPLLIYDPHLHVLAAIHAGWRGTVAGIAEKVIRKMTKQYNSFPSTLLAAIGPAISQKYFEVGDEVAASFSDTGFLLDDISYRNNDSGKIHIDLKLANKIMMVNAGIPHENIEVSDLCTYSNPNLFFSARRQTTHSGRMVTGGILR